MILRGPAYLFRGEVTGWRARSLAGALGLRSPRADHSVEESAVLREAAAGRRRVVEVGALEGGGSTVMRSVMQRGGQLVVVDPYARGRLGFSAARVVARRAARRQRRVRTVWIRASSIDAAAGWDGEIDACVIDAIHTAEGVRMDWAAWGRFVKIGGRVAVRNDVVHRRDEPVELRSQATLAELAPCPGEWELAGAAGTFSAYLRTSRSSANA